MRPWTRPPAAKEALHAPRALLHVVVDHEKPRPLISKRWLLRGRRFQKAIVRVHPTAIIQGVNPEGDHRSNDL